MCFFQRSCCLNSSIESRLHFQKGADFFFLKLAMFFFLFSKRWKIVLNWIIAKPGKPSIYTSKRILNWVCYSKSLSLDGVNRVLVTNHFRFTWTTFNDLLSLHPKRFFFNAFGGDGKGRRTTFTAPPLTLQVSRFALTSSSLTMNLVTLSRR